MTIPHTLGELRTSQFTEQRMLRRGVKDELRENLLAAAENQPGRYFLALSAMTTR